MKKEKKKIREIQDLIVMINDAGEFLQSSATDILNFYNDWVRGIDELETLIKVIDDTLKATKYFEKDLRKLKNLLKDKASSENSSHKNF